MFVLVWTKLFKYIQKKGYLSLVQLLKGKWKYKIPDKVTTQCLSSSVKLDRTFVQRKMPCSLFLRITKLTIAQS